MILKKFDTLPSTHTWLKEDGRGEAPMTMVTVREQNAGRGQRGNRWESEPGKNLTFSMHYRPEGVPPISQFSVSEAVALAVSDFLKLHGVETKVKWPNDIYAGDKKISGILIDHEICGREITRTVASAGINLNQTEWRSDAPNPVSVKELTGNEVSPDESAIEIAAILERRLPQAATTESREKLHEEFLSRLWRNDGACHPYLIKATGELKQGRITAVAGTGTLTLTFADGETRDFAFKEVEFIL